jgi:hypothetical protein
MQYSKKDEGYFNLTRRDAVPDTLGRVVTPFQDGGKNPRHFIFPSFVDVFRFNSIESGSLYIYSVSMETRRALVQPLARILYITLNAPLTVHLSPLRNCSLCGSSLFSEK